MIISMLYLFTSLSLLTLVLGDASPATLQEYKDYIDGSKCAGSVDWDLYEEIDPVAILEAYKSLAPDASAFDIKFDVKVANIGSGTTGTKFLEQAWHKTGKSSWHCFGCHFPDRGTVYSPSQCPIVGLSQYIFKQNQILQQTSREIMKRCLELTRKSLLGIEHINDSPFTELFPFFALIMQRGPLPKLYMTFRNPLDWANSRFRDHPRTKTCNPHYWNNVYSGFEWIRCGDAAITYKDGVTMLERAYEIWDNDSDLKEKLLANPMIANLPDPTKDERSIPINDLKIIAAEYVRINTANLRIANYILGDDAHVKLFCPWSEENLEEDFLQFLKQDVGLEW